MIDSLPSRLRDLLVEVCVFGVRRDLGPCWLYVGRRFSRNGYARVWWEGREVQLHNVVWGLVVGRPPTPGLLRDHLCRQRDCSNPGHLEETTVQINTLRGDAVLFGGCLQRLKQLIP